MRVIDTVNKTELDLTAEEIIDLVANHNRQVDLIFAEKRTDEDGYLMAGRALSDYSGYNKYDLKGCFLPQEAKEVRLG